MDRVEEYLVATSTWSDSKTSAKRVTADQVAEACRKAGATLPLGYYVYTAQHESNFAVNERDTEPSGFMSYGVFQLSMEEARSVKKSGANLLDLDVAARVLVLIAENRRVFIRGILKLRNADPDPKDMAAYVAICHNAGENDGTFKNLPKYGLDFTVWKERNGKESKERLARALVSLSNLMDAKASQDKIEAATAELAKAKSYAKWVVSMSAYGTDCLKPWPPSSLVA